MGAFASQHSCLIVTACQYRYQIDYEILQYGFFARDRPGVRVLSCVEVEIVILVVGTLQTYTSRGYRIQATCNESHMQLKIL